MDSIIKNPIIIGVLAGVITYAYLTWDTEEKNKKRKSKDKEEVNLMIPFAVSIIIWFIAYAYFEYTPEPTIGHMGENDVAQILQTQRPFPLPIAPAPGYKFVKDVISESSDPRSFSLVTNGVNVPKNLPDVWHDLF